ncbi:MAG: hypothetical protein M1814_004787 [Vezdaea aestivalis]|nr:MAG: hypothetical protein M1814_004787 [Vezdaea aestivalis]
MEKPDASLPPKDEGELAQATEPVQAKLEPSSAQQQVVPKEKKVKKCCHKHGKKKPKKTTAASSSDSSSDSSDSESESESEESEAAEDSEDESSETDEEERERQKRKEKKKKRARKAAQEKSRSRRKAKGKKRAPVSDSESETSSEAEDSSADDEASSEDEKPRRSKRKTKRITKRRSRKVETDSENESDAESEDEGGSRKKSRKSQKSKRKSRKNKSKKIKGSVNIFKRLDQLWDTNTHDWKVTESADVVDEESHADCAFAVRRKFDWDNKYEATFIDINSKPLRDALAIVFEGVNGISLVEETPALDPNMLFLYYDETKKLMKKFKVEAKDLKKKKKKKLPLLKALHLKLLLKYIDEDYTDVRKRLHPMLESGQISFDLLWALFKPNSIAYTTTYGSTEVPRAFKIESAAKESSFMRGTWYSVTGRYLEFDGEIFGIGTTYVDVDQWKGSKKVTSLPCYPLKYHKTEAATRKQLIERGRKFVSLAGQHHMCMSGLAFYKRKKAIVKVNITSGRVMISPALFRRINPNYPISQIKRRTDEDDDSDDECSDSDCCCHGAADSDDEGNPAPPAAPLGNEEVPEKTVRRFIKDPKTGKWEMVTFTVDADGEVVMPSEKLEAEGEEKQEFTDEELLIAGPVVLGFAFSEKLWLEMSLEGIDDIKWQPEAFDSLVLSTPTHKAVMRALVEMNRDQLQENKNIQDVVQKKGAGLIAVLHGPPGTGKTLTAEGIAELLECPLYQVSAGELGTDPRTLEAELNKLLDITHSWNAILLLDEADVFLEQRVASDIHRNALVSIFLRLLEYHQGILMMTTNRVETFDEAFQSRIHIALRYSELSPKARKAIWTTFLTKAHEKDNSAVFKDEDYDALSRRTLNGRQIKNTVRTAISLACSRKQSLDMATLKEVLEVQADFERDLKGGTGYKDAMASYF